MTDVTRDPGTDRRLEPTGRARDVDDEILRELAGQARDRRPDREGGDVDVDRGLPGRSRDVDVDRGAPSDAPFTLALPAPRAIDLRRLWKLAGKTPDPMITAGFGRKFPVLLSHGVTALPRPGRKPARVWGLGYKVELNGVAADTVDLQPTTELLDVVQVGAQATVDIGLDGSLEVPKAARDALSSIPGVALTAARVAASATENAKLTISFTLSVPKLIAGPGDGHGGAEWNLYAQDRRLEGHQALLQTLLVPKGTKQLSVAVTGWVREAGWFGPKEWLFETAAFTIDLER